MTPTTQDIMISAIEHHSYCPRQCALIHLEQIFDENVFTLRGRTVHERVDTPTYEMQGTLRIERALPLWSEQYGLHGKADTVEFRPDGTIYPVEYKHGARREKIHDDLQLAAQAVCLEEMFTQTVTHGAIYYHTTRRRREVPITEALRAQLAETLAQIRHTLHTRIMPPALDDARCTHCSLLDACVPRALNNRRVAQHKHLLYTITDTAE